MPSPASPRPRRPMALAAMLATLMLAACSASTSSIPPAGASAESSPVPSATVLSAPSLVLRVTTEGGFIGPAANLATVPDVSVYADGRILTPAPPDSSDPQPLLPSVAMRDVGAAGEARIVAAIRAAGLDLAASSDAGGVIPGDTGTTVFAVSLDGAVVTTRLVLAGGPPGRPGLASPNPTAQAAADLLARLEDPNEAWGDAPASMSRFQPSAYRVYAAPGPPSGDGSTTAPAIDWPIATPLASFGVPSVPDRGITGLRQGAVFGADAAVLGRTLTGLSSQTPFISGGMLYTLYVRPLLPDEVPAAG